MKNSIVFTALAIVMMGLISSCGSSGDEPGGYTPTKVLFKSGEIARYDLFLRDTADKFGNNNDIQIPDPDNPNQVEEKVVDTAVPFMPNILATKMILASNPPDTSYYYQDNDGNLWRYNYGFSKLNNYDFLVQNLGQQVNVGWVLVAKPGAPAGTTWVAKKDSMNTSQFGKLSLEDNATAMSDTMFSISNGLSFVQVNATHTRHIVNGHTDIPGLTAEIVVDFYFSPELGLTVRDVFHSSSIELLSLHTRGSEKIMTFFKP